MKKIKLFALAVAALFTGSAMAVDYTSLNYNGEATVPAGYKYYGSSAGKEDPNIFVTLSYEGRTVFDVTGGGGGAYNKRAMEFTLTEDCSVELELIPGNAGRIFRIYQGSTLLNEKTLTTKNETYTVSYDFKGATESAPITYSFTGSGSKVYAAKITFTAAAPITVPIVKAYTIAGINATIDETAKTITAELPYGTNKDAAIDAAIIELGGTATSSSYNVDTTELTVTDGTNNATYTLNFTIGEFKCGEIINATLTSGTAATVTGTVGGTASVSLSSSKKLDKGKYFGITLASGTFMEGDVVNINVATVAGQGVVAIYADKEMTTPLYVAEDWGVAGDNEFILSKEATGRTSLWIARNDEINKWNPVLNSISVTRACEAGIASFQIGGVEATIDQEQKTITAELPFGTELNDALWAAATYVIVGPATAASYNTEHTTLTVGETVYTLNITVAAELSNDNTLKSLSVNGTAITLVAEQLAYTYVLPYGTTEIPVVAAEANDLSATIAITQIETVSGTASVVVTAANGDAATYTVEISVADAPKFLTEVVFSNGAKGAINAEEAKVSVPYLAGTEEPTVVGTLTTEGEGASATVNEDGTITLKGIDEKETIYTVEKIALTPASDLGTEVVTFDGTETYFFAPYGWDTEKGKGWKFAKNVEEAGNRRVSKGNTRIYIALPAAKSVILTSGSGGNRDIKVYVNGVENASVTSTGASGETKEIALNATSANFVAIESNQTAGDGGFIALQIVPSSESALINAEVAEQAQKVMVGGQLMIIKNGVMYNAQGAIVK